MFRSSTQSSKLSRSRGGRFCRRIRGRLFAVKSPVDFLPQSFFFGGIVGVSHSLGKSGQFFARKLALARQFKSKVKHPRLFSARQLFDFLNDGCGGHGLMIAQIEFRARGNVIPNRGQFRLDEFREGIKSPQFPHPSSSPPTRRLASQMERLVST